MEFLWVVFLSDAKRVGVGGIFLALVEDAEQGFQIILAALLEVRNLHDDAVVGEAFDEVLLVRNVFAAGGVKILTDDSDHRRFGMVERMPEQVDAQDRHGAQLAIDRVGILLREVLPPEIFAKAHNVGCKFRLLDFDNDELFCAVGQCDTGREIYAEHRDIALLDIGAVLGRTECELDNFLTDHRREEKPSDPVVVQ